MRLFSFTDGTALREIAAHGEGAIKKTSPLDPHQKAFWLFCFLSTQMRPVLEETMAQTIISHLQRNTRKKTIAYLEQRSRLSKAKLRMLCTESD